MKILVTGANGYIGQGVVSELLKLGNEVIAADIRTEHVDSRAKSIDCNMFEIDNPYAFFECPEVVLHLAWRDGFVHYSDAHLKDLPKHYEFLKKLSDEGVERIAVMGTMHEVGFYEGCIKANTPCNPKTPYAVSKNALRQLASDFCSRNNTKFQWLRGYYIVGNATQGSSIFSKITAAAERGEKSFPFTYGQNQFDFIDYDVFCEQISHAVNQDSVLGTINICSGKPEKLADRVERFIKDNSYEIKLKYGAFAERPYESKAVWGDNTEIKMIMNKINERTSI